MFCMAASEAWLQAQMCRPIPMSSTTVRKGRFPAGSSIRSAMASATRCGLGAVGPVMCPEKPSICLRGASAKLPRSPARRRSLG